MPTTFLGLDIERDSDLRPDGVVTVGGADGDRLSHSIEDLSHPNGWEPFSVELVQRVRLRHMNLLGHDPDTLLLSPRPYEDAMAFVMRFAEIQQAPSQNYRRAPTGGITFRGATPTAAPIAQEDDSGRYRDARHLWPTNSDSEVYLHPPSEEAPDSEDGVGAKFTIAAGVDRDHENPESNMVGCTLICPGFKLSFSDAIVPWATAEQRTEALKRMRLQLFKHLQRRVREEFEREKERYPEVWHRSTSVPPAGGVQAPFLSMDRLAEITRDITEGAGLAQNTSEPTSPIANENRVMQNYFDNLSWPAPPNAGNGQTTLGANSNAGLMRPDPGALRALGDDAEREPAQGTARGNAASAPEPPF